MKVFLFSSDNNLKSGAFLSLCKFAYLLRNNHQVDILVIIPNQGEGQKLLEQYNIPYIIVRSYSWVIDTHPRFVDILKVPFKIIVNFITILQLSLLMKKHHPDIVHINTSWTYVGAVAAMILKIPVVWHIREYLEEDQNKKIWIRNVGYHLINRSNRIIAISYDLKKKYDKFFNSSKLCVIYNGIDPDEFYNPTKKIFSHDSYIFSCIGGLREGKGQKVLIEACNELIQNGIYNYLLYIVGNGPEEKNLKNLVNQLNLNDYIQFEGFNRDTKLFYEKSDVFFMTSKCEAFGRVTIEGMLGGCLIIGSDTGATPEILENNTYGYLYKAGDAKDLSKKIIYAINHQEEAIAVMNKGRRRALEQFNSNKNAAEIYHIYCKII